jgi:hypothetical protein
MTRAKSDKRILVSFSLEEFEEVSSRFKQERDELLEDLREDRLTSSAQRSAQVFLAHLERVLSNLEEAEKNRTIRENYSHKKSSPEEAS